MTKKKCLICGGLYTYCNTCYEDRFKPAWYQIFCSEECKEIDGIISANTVGELSDIKAKRELEKLNLSGKKFHKQKVKDKIDYFLGLDETEKELDDIKEKEVDDKKNTTEILNDSNSENGQNKEYKTKSSKRNYSKNWKSNSEK